MKIVGEYAGFELMDKVHVGNRLTRYREPIEVTEMEGRLFDAAGHIMAYRDDTIGQWVSPTKRQNRVKLIFNTLPLMAIILKVED